MKTAVVLLVLSTMSVGCRPAAPWREMLFVDSEPVAARARPAPTTVVRSQRWSFRVPRGWDVRVSERGDAAIARGRAPQRSVPLHVTLAVETFHGPSAWMARERLAGHTGVVVLGTRETRAGTLPATDVEAIFTEGDPSSRVVQRYTTDAGLGFVLTCAGERGWRQEEIRAECALVLGSFRVQP